MARTPATSFVIPSGLRAAAKAKAAAEGRTLTAVVVELLRVYTGERVVYDDGVTGLAGGRRKMK